MPGALEQPVLRASVIIPTYNRAEYLGEALQSVLDQTLHPFEIVVVDDGSTDCTADIGQVLGSSVRYIRHARNRGVSAARNSGLDAARGDLIAWLDADDLWEPDFLASVVPLLEADEGVDGIYTGFVHIDDVGNGLPQPGSRVVPAADLYAALAEDCFLVTPSIVVRKRCFERTGHFDPELGICEDYDMWLRLAKEFTILGLPSPLVRIRVHQNNMMRNADAFCRFRLELAQKHFGQPEGDSLGWPVEKQRAYGFAYRAAALSYFQQGQPDLGSQFLGQAVDVYPPLLGRVDTFYELACGDQPRGIRGQAEGIDLAANGTEMLRWLDALLAGPFRFPKGVRAAAYGNAYLALGMLADQAGDWPAARRYLLRAVRADARLLRDRSVLRRLTKVMAGQRLVGLTRRVASREGGAKGFSRIAS